MLVLGISESGRLVQQNDGGILEDGPCKSDALLFPTGEIDALGPQHRVHALWQLFQNIVALGRPERLHHLFSGRIRPGGADIFKNAGLQQLTVLKHKGDAIHQLLLGDLRNRNASNADRPLLHIPKPGNQSGGGGFSAARSTYQSHSFPLRDLERQVKERGRFGARIGKGHIPELHIIPIRYPCKRVLHHGSLCQQGVNPPHRFLRHHPVCAGKQDFIEDAGTSGSKQDVKNQIQQELAVLFRANQEDTCRNQHSKGGVDDDIKGHHRPLAGERVFRYIVLVVHDSGVKALKGVDRLLEHLDHRDTAYILHRLIVHLFRSVLVFPHIGHGFLAGHQHLYHKPRNQQKNGQAA